MKKINEKKVRDILKYIEDKDSFIIELVSAINKSISRNDSTFIQECIGEWEASSELNSIPGFSKKVRNRFNSLMRAGLIK